MTTQLGSTRFASGLWRQGVVWVRFLAAVRRGSSLVWIHKLPFRVTESGKGGGGPIFQTELGDAMLVWSDEDEPNLFEGPVVQRPMMAV